MHNYNLVMALLSVHIVHALMTQSTTHAVLAILRLVMGAGVAVIALNQLEER